MACYKYNLFKYAEMNHYFAVLFFYYMQKKLYLCITNQIL